MDIVNLIGIAAACFTTGCWLPQVIKILRTGDVSAISLVTYAAFSTGVFLWLIYGLMANALPVILANAVTFILSMCIVIMKIWYERRATRSLPQLLDQK